MARRYLAGRLSEIGLSPFTGESFELPFRRSNPLTTESVDFVNLVAVVPGTDRKRPAILVGAHYDSVLDGPCADDNATAVAVVLATAEHFAHRPLRRDVILALFDSEEPPFFQTPAMGSTRFFEDHCSNTDLVGAVVMDLIGHDVELDAPEMDALWPRSRELLFVLGAESDRHLPRVVESAAARVENLSVFPTLNEYVGDLSDHHAFRLGGRAFLFLSCGQGKYYHQPRGDRDWINLDKVERVCDFVIQLVLSAEGIESTGPRRARRSRRVRDPDDREGDRVDPARAAASRRYLTVEDSSRPGSARRPAAGRTRLLKRPCGRRRAWVRPVSW